LGARCESSTAAGIFTRSSKPAAACLLDDLLALALHKAISGEPRRPDHICPNNVYVDLPGLELSIELVEMLPRISAHLPQPYLHTNLTLLVEPVYQRLHTSRRVRKAG